MRFVFVVHFVVVVVVVVVMVVCFFPVRPQPVPFFVIETKAKPNQARLQTGLCGCPVHV